VHGDIILICLEHFLKLGYFFSGYFSAKFPPRQMYSTVLFTAIRSAAAGMYCAEVLSLRALPEAAGDGMNQSMSEVKNFDKLISLSAQKQQCA
jgi:hypothetical protein